MTAFDTHREFEERFPELAAMEAVYEQHRQERYAAVHGSLAGYVALREFPCPGTLTVEDQFGPIQVLGCSACPFVTTVKAGPRPVRDSDGSDW